ncbi:MAG: hypothetical protein ACJ8EU_04755 [Xanthobacteraceae bacterium]
MPAHSFGVWAAAYSPEGSRIITTSGDGIARIWEAASGKAVAVLQGTSGA